MLKVITGGASKGYKKKKPEIERSKIIYKFARLKRSRHYHRLEVYMYGFMYVNTETMPVEDPFPDTKKLL